MENSSDIIGNRTRDLLTCSAVPQLTASGSVEFTSTPFPLFLTLVSRRSKHDHIYDLIGWYEIHKIFQEHPC